MKIPPEAIQAAKEALFEVTPPPGTSKAEWLAEHGDFALIAGAIAAAAPHLAATILRDAADSFENLPALAGAGPEPWGRAKAVARLRERAIRVTQKPVGPAD